MYPGLTSGVPFNVGGATSVAPRSVVLPWLVVVVLLAAHGFVVGVRVVVHVISV